MAALLIALTGLSCAILLIALLTDTLIPASKGIDLLAGALFLIFMGVAFACNKRGRTDLAAKIIIGVCWIVIFVTTIPGILGLFPPYRPGDANLLIYLIVPVLFASVFLSIRETMLIACFTVVAMLLLPLIYSELSFVLLLAGPVGFFVLVSGLILVASRHRTQLERLRQVELREKEEIQRSLLETNFEGIAITESGVIVEANTGFAEMFGGDVSDVIGQALIDLFAETSKDALVTSLEKENDQPREMVGLRQGYEVDLEMIAKTVRRHGHPVQVVAVRDISERKRLEQQLRQSQKMEAIGQLAGGVAHDFNNLLTGIIGNLSLAEEDAPHGLREYIASANSAAMRAEDLVKQLLAFSRKTRVELKPLDLNGIVREVYQLARETIDRRIDIDVRLTDETVGVLADAAQMHSVLMNLCVNARDAITPIMHGSERLEDSERQFLITLETDVITVDSEYCNAHAYARPGCFAVLIVADTGEGMNSETQRHIFEPFFTTKEVGAGTGLGLASVYGIVKQHDGWINVYSEKGKGTTFKIYLPLVQESAPGEDDVKRDGVVGGSERILIVDDEDAIRNLAKRVLEQHGYSVLLASDGQEGLDTYFRESGQIDLIVLDLSMPRMSGREVLERLREQAPDVKVIISTGYAEGTQAEILQNLNISAYVYKPYRPLEITRLVRRVLDSSA